MVKITLTAHAALRFMERMLEIDVESQRRPDEEDYVLRNRLLRAMGWSTEDMLDLMPMAQIEAALRCGASKVSVGGITYALLPDKLAIATVYGKSSPRDEVRRDYGWNRKKDVQRGCRVGI